MDESEEELQRQREDYAYDLLKAKNIEIAKKMLADNMDIDIISKYTGFSEEEIEKLK